MRAPLPVCPRPLAGEALRSWLTRVGRPYSLSAEDLAQCLSLNSPGDTVDAVNIVLLAECARVPIAHVTALLSGPPSWTLRERHACVVCWRCLAEDLQRREPVHLRSIWRQAWRVFCPQHAARLDAAPVRSLFPRRSRRSHPRGRVPEFIHRHLQNSSAEAPHQRGLGREAIVGAIQTIENAITGALCGTRPETDWGLLSSKEFLKIISDLTAWALSNFEAFRAQPPAAQLPSIVSMSSPKIFTPPRRLLAPYGGERSIRTLPQSPHPGLRCGALWWAYALMAQGHPTTKLRRDPRDRQQHFLRGRTPAGLAWLHARMDAWPADYVADRWVDLSQWLMPGLAPLPFTDTIRGTNRAVTDTNL